MHKLCDQWFREELSTGKKTEYVDGSYRIDWEYLMLKNPDAGFTMTDIDRIDNVQTNDG